MVVMTMPERETETAPEHELPMRRVDRDLPAYSPAKLKLLLRLYPHMHPSDSRVPLDREMTEIVQAVGYRSWPSDSECDYYSLVELLSWLAERDVKAELAVRLAYAVGMSTREVGQALRVSNATAWRWCDDGVRLMAWRSGWRERVDPAHPFVDVGEER